jgi:phage terminase large subunit
MYQLNPYLREYWCTPSRIKNLFGGRASSKSHDAAGHAVHLAANYSLRFLCARQFQNRIEESVYVLIKQKIQNSEFVSEFKIANTYIEHKETGSEFMFYGIARNLKEIKSTEDIDVLWLEEAHYLTPDQWEVLEPTIRKEDSEIWLIWNPDDIMDFAYQYFVVNKPEDCLNMQINWDQNPFLSRTMLKVIKDHYKRDPKGAEHIYGGVPKTGADKSVISLEYILSAIDAHKKIGGGKWVPEGPHRVGYDIADDGLDLNALVEAHGNIVKYAEDFEGLEDQLLKSSTKVYNYAMIKGASITYDSIGVGAHAGSKFAELNEAKKLTIEYDPFNAGGAVEDPDGVYMKLPHITITNRAHFSNIKAQKWDEVATRFRKTHEMVKGEAIYPFDELVSLDSSSIPPNAMNKLKFELSAPHKDVDLSGRFKVESKKDMATRGIKSPNLADAFIMSLIKPKRKKAGFFDV